MSAEIRTAESGDVGAIRSVARDAWYAAYGGFLDPDTVERALGSLYDPDLIEGAISEEEIAFFVAVDDGEVVGFASAEATWTDELELHTIYVDPERWGEGVGSALLERVEAFARSEGVDRISTAVFVDNVVGVGFLESRGFEAGREVTTELAGERHTEREFERPL